MELMFIIFNLVNFFEEITKLINLFDPNHYIIIMNQFNVLK